MHNFTLEIINMTTSVLPDFNIMCMKNHFYALKEYLYKSIISEFHINIRQTQYILSNCNTNAMG